VNCFLKRLPVDTLEGYMENREMTEITYRVPNMSCEHCRHAVSSELSRVAGVASVDVDLQSKAVTVRGSYLDDVALRSAIEEAGYEAA
jgi:copper chaperone